MPCNNRKISLDQQAEQQVANDKKNHEYLRLSRQKICHIEINAAVRMFIIDEDPISAHLLASAATEIMTALSNGKSGVGLNDLRALIKNSDFPDSEQKELFQSLLHPYNFLKHSSSDLKIKNDFRIDQIVVTIWSAIHSYKLLFGNISDEMTVFYDIVQFWLAHWWKDTLEFGRMQRAANQLQLTGATREEVCAFGRKALQSAKKTEITSNPFR